MAAACATSPKEAPNYDKEFLENLNKFSRGLRENPDGTFMDDFGDPGVTILNSSMILGGIIVNLPKPSLGLALKKANSSFSAIYTNFTPSDTDRAGDYTATLTNKSKGIYLIISNAVTGFGQVYYLTNSP